RTAQGQDRELGRRVVLAEVRDVRQRRRQQSERECDGGLSVHGMTRSSFFVATIGAELAEEGEPVVEKYLLIPLDDTVVFPGMTATLPVDVGSESRVLVVPRHESVYAKVGTVAEVGERGRLPGGAQVATLTGLHRALIGAAETGAGGRLYVEVEERPDETPAPIRTRELETEYRAVVQEILELREADPRIGEFLR